MVPPPRFHGLRQTSILRRRCWGSGSVPQLLIVLIGVVILFVDLISWCPREYTVTENPCDLCPCSSSALTFNLRPLLRSEPRVSPSSSNGRIETQTPVTLRSYFVYAGYSHAVFLVDTLITDNPTLASSHVKPRWQTAASRQFPSPCELFSFYNRVDAEFTRRERTCLCLLLCFTQQHLRFPNANL